jgi:pilus assembly protein CpaC
MSPSNPRDAMRGAVMAFLLMLVPVAVLSADTGEKIRIAVGHAYVVPSLEDVRTVAIAEPDIADAAVGSARTVIVTAKAAGSTNLVVYTEGGRYRTYDIEAYVPNGDKQVLLHCTIAEVTDAAMRELGLDLVGGHDTKGHAGLDGWLQGGLFTSKITSGPYSPLDPSVPFNFESSADIVLDYFRHDGRLSFETAIKALEQKGDVRTLANPSLLATSGEKATFLAGGEFAYQVVVGTGGSATASIAFKEFGVRLEFTPVVQEDGSIRLKVAPEVSEPDYSRSILGVPPLNTRKVSTIVTLNSGEYLVIGGLKDTRTNKLKRKVPVLGDIPLLGALFTYVRNETSTRDLMVILSPEIVGSLATQPVLPTDQPESK